MSLTFLVGAIIGSGAFIILGRAPAQKLVDAVAARIGKPREARPKASLPKAEVFRSDIRPNTHTCRNEL